VSWLWLALLIASLIGVAVLLVVDRRGFLSLRDVKQSPWLRGILALSLVALLALAIASRDWTRTVLMGALLLGLLIPAHPPGSSS
jgi:hypothetical protein